MTTLSDLISEITSQLPTGVDHQITAAKVRTVLIDIATRLAGDIAVGGGVGSGGGTAERYLTSSSTASPGDVCYCNTAAGGFTITLPANPVPGMGVGFRDAEGSWGASHLTIFPGTNTIEGASGNLICDVTNGNFDLVWSGPPGGWQFEPVVSTAGFVGGGGAGASYYHVSANFTADFGGIYYCDTLPGSFTATLPSGPAVGSGISFRDATGNWSNANLVLDPGANNINGVTGTLQVDQSDINFDVLWRGAPTGWQIEIAINNSARGAIGSPGFLTTRPLGALGQAATVTRGGAVAWSTTDKHSNVALSGGNLTATATASAASLSLNATSVRATTSGTPGRYFEITWGSGGTPNGFALSTSSQSLSLYPGDPNSISFFSSGYVEWPGSGFSNNWGGTWGIGDVMGALLGASNVQLFKNGTVVYTVNTLPSGPLYPLLALKAASETATANFGATAMAFLPSGGTSWDGSRTSTGAVTWNVADSSGVALSNGNLTVTGIGGGGQVKGTRAGSALRYFEVHIDADAAAGSIYVGLANPSVVVGGFFASDPNGICYFDNGYANWPGSGTSNVFATYGAGDTIGVELLTSSAQFYKNGTLIFTASAIPSGALYPIVGVYASTASLTADFGATTFAHLPSGASGWNT